MCSAICVYKVSSPYGKSAIGQMITIAAVTAATQIPTSRRTALRCWSTVSVTGICSPILCVARPQGPGSSLPLFSSGSMAIPGDQVDSPRFIQRHGFHRPSFPAQAHRQPVPWSIHVFHVEQEFLVCSGKLRKCRNPQRQVIGNQFHLPVYGIRPVVLVWRGVLCGIKEPVRNRRRSVMCQPHQRQAAGNHHRQFLMSRALDEFPRGGATRLHFINLAVGSSPEMKFMNSSRGKNKNRKERGRTYPYPGQHVSEGERYADCGRKNIPGCHPGMHHSAEDVPDERQGRESEQ